MSQRFRAILFALAVAGFLILGSNLAVMATDGVSAQNGDWNTNSTWTGSNLPGMGGDTATINHTVTKTGGANNGLMVDTITINVGKELRGASGQYIGATTITNNGTLSLSNTHGGATTLGGNGLIVLTNGSSLSYTPGNFVTTDFSVKNISIGGSLVAANLKDTTTLVLAGSGVQLGSVTTPSTVGVIGSNNVIASPNGTALTMGSGGKIEGSTTNRANSVLSVANVNLVYGQNSALGTVKTSDNAIKANGALTVKNVTLQTTGIDMSSQALTVDNATIKSVSGGTVTAQYLTKEDVISGQGSGKIANPTPSTGGIVLQDSVWDGTSAFDHNPGLKSAASSISTTTDPGLMNTITNAKSLTLNNGKIEGNLTGLDSISLGSQVNEITGTLAVNVTFDTFGMSGNASNTSNTELHLGGFQFKRIDSAAENILTLSGMLTTYIKDVTNSNIKSIVVDSGAGFGAGGTLDGNVVFNSGSLHTARFSDFNAKSISYQNNANIYVGYGASGVNQIVATGNIDFASTTNIHIVNTEGVTGAQNLSDIFHSDTGLRIGTIDLTDSSHTANSLGVASISNAGGSINVLSNKATSGFVTGVTVDDGGKSLSVNYTGTAVKDTFLDQQSADNPPIPVPDPNPTPFPGGLNSPNRLSIRNALSPALALAYNAQPNDASKASLLDQLSPILNTATPMVAQRTVSRLTTSHYSRMRTMMNFDSIKGFDINGYPDPNVYLGQLKSVPCRQFWVTNYGDWTGEKGNYGDRNNGFYSNMYGLNVGYDKYQGDNFTSGLSIGGSWAGMHSEIDGVAQGDVSTVVTSAFGSWTNHCWFIGGTVGYSYSGIRIDRNLPTLLGTLSSSHGGHQAFVSFEATRKIDLGWCYVNPYYGLDFVFLHETGYDETGIQIAQTHIEDRNTESYLQNFGVRWGTEFLACDHWVFEPSFYGGWVHDYGGGRIHSVGSFTNNGNGQFSIAGVDMHQNRGVMGLNLNVAFTNYFGAHIRWDSEFAPEFNANNFEGGLRVVW